MYDDAELRENMAGWLLLQQASRDASSHSTRDSFATTDSAAQKAIFFLILAIGAQTCPDDCDELADKYVNYGRYLTVCGATIEPSMSTIQAYTLLTMYLLSASRRNAAFMYLGIAVRAAYALGIHRRDINAALDPDKFAQRERLWKVLRILDLFLSTSLGRPPATHETRDTKSEANYSTSIDLCAIFEAILTQVYSTRTVSTSTIETISEQHRLWTARYASGLATDGLQSEPYVVLGTDGEKSPNIGLFHLKEAYYWTSMLLSRPFLIENISRRITRAKAQASAESGINTPANMRSPSDDILAYACVDSAIRTMCLLQGLLSAPKVPKRLPFIVNSAFVSALVLGFAHFGDLDRVFPIGKSLAIAQEVLALFGRHDAIAKRYASIVVDLQAACDAYQEKRARGKMERHSVLIDGLFGTVEGGESAAASTALDTSTASTNNSGWTPDEAVGPRSLAAGLPSMPSQPQSQQQRRDQVQQSLYLQRGVPDVSDPLHFVPQDGQGDSALPENSPSERLQPSPQQQQQLQEQHRLSITPSIQPHPSTYQKLPHSGNLTPPPADETDEFFVDQSSGDDGILLQQHHAPVFQMNDSSEQLMPHMPSLPDMIMALSPRMLNFGSFDKNLQLFPTMDAAGLF